MSLADSLAEIADAQSVTLLREVINCALGRMGYSRIYYVTPVTHDRRFGRVLTAVGFPEHWAGNYQDTFHLDDPMPDVALDSAEPFLWSKVEDLVTLTKAEKQFMSGLLAGGAMDGVAVPTFGPASRSGFVGAGRPVGQQGIEQSELAAVHAICQMSFLRYSALIGGHGNLPRLSDREVEVVGWMAAGKSNAVIAEIIGISSETVDTYVRRIYSKFSVSDRASAVLKANAEGYIFINSYRETSEAGE